MCDITIGDDDLLVKIDGSVRARYSCLTETSGGVIFRQPHFKSDSGRLQSRASLWPGLRTNGHDAEDDQGKNGQEGDG